MLIEDTMRSHGESFPSSLNATIFVQLILRKSVKRRPRAWGASKRCTSRISSSLRRRPCGPTHSNG